jgi:hypothetical protein
VFENRVLKGMFEYGEENDRTVEKVTYVGDSISKLQIQVAG